MEARIIQRGGRGIRRPLFRAVAQRKERIRLANQLLICSRGGGVGFGGRRSCFLEEVRAPVPEPVRAVSPSVHRFTCGGKRIAGQVKCPPHLVVR
jgi:hypothetical protein